MKCVYCNSDLVNGAQFCSECGKPQPTYKICTTCGQTVLADAVYCENCGAYLRGANSVAPLPESPKSGGSRTVMIVLISLLGLMLAGGIAWAVYEFALNDEGSKPAMTMSKTDEEIKQQVMDSLNSYQGIPSQGKVSNGQSGTPTRVVVTGDGVRLRTSPEINDYNIHRNRYGREVHPYKGQSLPYKGESGLFYLVVYKGDTYYIAKEFTRPRYD